MQSNGGRALIALLAVVILVGGFFLLTGEEDAGEGSGDTANSTSTSATTTEEQTTGEKDETSAEDMEPKPEPEPELTTIVTKGGAPVDGVTELEFDAGDEVRFAVESDIAEEVHVHGYDIEQDLEPGKVTEFEFPADLDGIFEVELHGSATQIAELTVNP